MTTNNEKKNQIMEILYMIHALVYFVYRLRDLLKSGSIKMD